MGRSERVEDTFASQVVTLPQVSSLSIPFGSNKAKGENNLRVEQL